MPNHIVNNIKITGADLSRFKKKYQESFESGCFFNTILPMPIILNTASGNFSKKVLPDFCTDTDQETDHSYLLNGEAPKSKSHWDIWTKYKQDCKRLYGTDDWYGWRCSNWGTKWDAYDSCGEWGGDLVDLIFSTAWCHCTPIVRSLSKEFPSLNFDVAYCDEGSKENTGWYEICLDSGIDESECHPDVSSSNEIYSEIMSRTYGEDWWVYDEDEECDELEQLAEFPDDGVDLESPSDRDMELFLFGDKTGGGMID